ncbi:hypothetical protein D3C78_832970 [compost metagenome]
MTDKYFTNSTQRCRLEIRVHNTCFNFLTLPNFRQLLALLVRQKRHFSNQRVVRIYDNESTQ